MENTSKMTDTKEKLRVSGLNAHGITAFELHPTATQRKAIAKQLGLIDVRKLRFTGKLMPSGNADWRLTGELGATVAQSCVVSLTPINSRIDVPVSRLFVAKLPMSDDPDDEYEIAETDESEPLGAYIDLSQVMAEALSLALPLYPKADDANLMTTTFTEEGKTPMSDEAARPFAALMALRDKLENDPE